MRSGRAHRCYIRISGGKGSPRRWLTDQGAGLVGDSERRPGQDVADAGGGGDEETGQDAADLGDGGSDEPVGCQWAVVAACSRGV